MKKTIFFLVVCLLITVCIGPVQATIKKVAQTGFQFLKVDVGSRAAAMGGAYMLVGDDATAMFYNPAGIAKISAGLDVFAGQTRWISDISYNSVALVKNLGNWGTVGLSGIFADYGTIEGTRVASNDQGYEETGNVEVGAYTMGLSYARSLSDKFTVGGQIKYVSQHLGSNLRVGGKTKDNTMSGLAYDFGTIFYPGFKSFRFGMSVRNFSKEFKYEQEGFQLPLTFAVGIAMDVMDFLGEHKNPLILAVDATHPRDYTERLNIGGEYTFMNMVALRAGYKYNYDSEGLTLGLGVMRKLAGVNFHLDYAYSDNDVFDAVNRFSVGFSF